MGVPDPDICQDTNQFDRALRGMSEVLFSGFGELSPQHRLTIVEYVMNKQNWASYNPKKLTQYGETASSSKSKSKSKSVGGGGVGGVGADGAATAATSSSASYAGSGGTSSASASAGAGAATMAMVQRVGPPGGGSFIIPIPGHNGALAGSLSGKTVVMTGVFPGDLPSLPSFSLI